MIQLADEVAVALRSRQPVVALETSVVAQGLPPPHNLEAARLCAAAVRTAGAVPAAIAIIDGDVFIGCGEKELQRLADGPAAKAGARDVAALCAQKRTAGTTVSATCLLAERVGIRVFATGGIGGVHRRLDPRDPPDVSADLLEISRRRVCVVCAGPKAILDLPATSEHLETLGVPVWGLGTSELPAFFTDGSGIALEHAFADARAVAFALQHHWDVLESSGGVLVTVPPPSPLPRAEVEQALQAALVEAAARKLPGKEVTPFLLSSLARATGGRSRTANVELLENNARAAAAIAIELYA
ncbi:MAG TPA: pseudouridine-5'-phosphate glycosidase [Myxococcales bacterium]|jgi:pseudouridine-5'-phosphate glycosidase|nr:pseudouridine-5'-phosphate glycosidase [Myxococcales bacterium]